MGFHDVSHFTAICAVLVAVISTGRTARLLIHDSFPPVEWLRLKILTLIGPDNKWAMLLRCQFCLAPYLAAGMLAWAYASDLNSWWWLINGWWAASYVAAIVVSYDEPEES